MKRLLALLAVMALTAVACGGSSEEGGGGTADAGDCPVNALDDATGTVDLVMWETFTGEPLRTMQALVAEYNASQDKVAVKMENQGVGYEEIQRKFNTAISTGSLGGLVVLEDTQTQFMADSGVIIPAQACAEADDYDLNQFTEVVRNFYSVDSVLQPGATNLSTGVMYYNRDHLTEAGLDPDSPPQTLAELKDAAQAIQDAGVTEKPFVMVLQPWFIEHWLTGDGVPIVNNNNGRDGLATEATFDNATTLELYTWLDEMNSAGLLNAVPGTEGQVDHYFAVALEQASITIETSTAISTINAVLEGTADPAEFGLDGDSLPAIDINVDVAAFPGISGPGQVQAGGGAVYIPNTNPPEVIAAAWDFIKWLNTPEIQAKWMIGATYIAWNTAAAEEQALIDWEANTRPGGWLTVAVDEINNLDPNFPGPLIGPYTDTREAIRQSLDELLLGGVSPADAVAKANDAISTALQRYEDENF
jgi:sn-glycerol 3-phosphate transport system substrate-binding protein